MLISQYFMNFYMKMDNLFSINHPVRAATAKGAVITSNGITG